MICFTCLTVLRVYVHSVPDVVEAPDVRVSAAPLFGLPLALRPTGPPATRLSLGRGSHVLGGNFPEKIGETKFGLKPVFHRPIVTADRKDTFLDEIVFLNYQICDYVFHGKKL